jgi:hypothetical protein
LAATRLCDQSGRLDMSNEEPHVAAALLLAVTLLLYAAYAERSESWQGTD